MAEEYFYRHLEENRRRHKPREDLIVQREKEVATEQRLTAYLCPCMKCHGGHWKTLKTIDIHRQQYGHDEHLMFSMLGGDPAGGYPTDGM
jgi:hypothetical protein